MFDLNPMHVAAWVGNPLVVVELIKAGANIKGSSSSCFLPLFFAVKRGNRKVIEAIIHHSGCGAYSHLVDSLLGLGSLVATYPSFPLIKRLVMGGDEFEDELFDLLVKLGERVDIKDHYGNILHYAAWLGNKRGASNLLKCGVGVDIVGPKSSTSLLIAASTGHIEVVRLLLENGANPKKHFAFHNSA